MLHSLLCLKAIKELNTINCIYSIKTYKIRGGWGFEIYKGKELLVNREHSTLNLKGIPFLSKKAAEKMAYVIIDEDRVE